MNLTKLYLEDAGEVRAESKFPIVGFSRNHTAIKYLTRRRAGQLVQADGEPIPQRVVHIEDFDARRCHGFLRCSVGMCH
jgi:hypothetical protein